MVEKQKRRRKGREGVKKPRPTCPTCGDDLKVSLEYARNESCRQVPKKYGWHCSKCKYEKWDEVDQVG